MSGRADGLNDIFENNVLIRDRLTTNEGTIQTTPVNDSDIVNKEYVDDLTTDHPHQDVNTTASPSFDNLFIDNQAYIGGVTSTSGAISGLVSQYNCNDNLATTNVIDTQGTNNGTSANNTSTMSVAGKINTALDFNGSTDKVNLGDDASFDFGAATDFSISFWMKSTQTASDPSVISNKDWSSGSNKGFVCHLEGNVIRMNVSDGSDRVDLDGSVVVNDDDWHHVVWTFDRDGLLKLYVDSVADGSASITSVGDIDGLPIYLGQDGTGAYSKWYDGALDDVRIYSGKILSQGDIDNIFNSNNGTEGNSFAFVHNVIATTSPYITSHGLGSLKDLAVEGKLEVNDEAFIDGDATVGGDVAITGDVTATDGTLTNLKVDHIDEKTTDHDIIIDATETRTSDGFVRCNRSGNGDDALIVSRNGVTFLGIAPYADDGLHWAARKEDYAASHNTIFTSFDYRAKDHDHSGTSTNPTVFIHAHTDPDTDNTQWMSFNHDKTDGVIEVGKGRVTIGDGTTKTNFLSIAKDGELNLHGTARVKKEFGLLLTDFNPGASGPTKALHDIFPTYEFTIGDDMHTSFELPTDWEAGTDITVEVYWAIDEAYATNSGEVRWSSDWRAVAVGELISAGSSGTCDFGDVDIPATANTVVKTEGTISGASLAQDDLIAFNGSRVALVAGSNPTAEPYIVAVRVEYTANKLGEAT